MAALLVHRAVGDQLTCVFVDHGLMRRNEGEQVVAAFRDNFHVPLVAVDAEDRFLARLAGVTDPETKRKIIGDEFIRVFESEAAKLDDPRFLVQGTLYSDVIESGGGSNTVSRWLIQHDCSDGRPCSRRPCSRTSSRARPNSPTAAGSIRPPSSRAMACMP